MDMAIAAASIDMCTNRFMGEVNIAVAGKAKDFAEQSAVEMLQTMLPPAPAPGSIGSKMDFLA